MRARLLLPISGAALLAVLLACGKQTYPQKPTLKLDRDSVGFAQEFGSGTFIGTAPQESLLLQNEGLEPLSISGVSITGDKEFTIDGPNVIENGEIKPISSIKGRGHAFIRILFEPTQAKSYSASLTISSNASNEPQKVVAVTGRGVPPPDGGQ